jgi:glycosyltransferase involved in cell wall biosynthesis
MLDPPLVSAVIPTHRRPKLVIRAIQSVLRQTYTPIEVIVVIDGIDDETRTVVEALAHPSVVCIETGTHVGPAEARNMGVRAANGTYIGLLDDDDEWVDNKITRQMQLVYERSLAHREFLLSCRTLHQVGGRSTIITPKMLYRCSDDLGEYLLHRGNPIARSGLIASGSVLFPRSLALRIPFPTDGAHEDMGWWLLCVTRDKVPLIMAEEALFIQHVDAATGRNQTQSWRESLAWARKYRAYMTGVAFAGLLSSTTAWRAKRQDGIRALLEVALAMKREGHTRAVHWLTLTSIALLPLSRLDKWRRNRR